MRGFAENLSAGPSTRTRGVWHVLAQDDASVRRENPHSRPLRVLEWGTR